ncbi:MAG: NUDIX hydrolase [Acidobacteriota bacterium]|nr:NUDIX hydrolase [Acidobacteriota bacterium]
MDSAAHNNSPTITTLASREVYRNRWMRVREDEILRSNGERGIYGVVDKPDAALVLPIDRGRIWLVEQYRYTVQQRVLEPPQGAWETKEGTPEELARGELREETGLLAGRMTYLGWTWIAYGYSSQRMHVYLAEKLTEGETDRDAEEHDLVVRSLTVEKFEEMMRTGEIRDCCTLAAWSLYRLWKAEQKQ